MTDEELVAMLQSTWTSIETLLTKLSDEEWGVLTDCPGWTVRDQVSHLIGFEQQWFLRKSVPPIEADAYAYVQNELGASNEAWITQRRSAGPNTLRTELSHVIEARIVQLNAARHFPQGLSTIITTFRGDETMRDALALRLFDIWVHEQDIRRAVGVTGNNEGPAMLHARDRMLDSLPWVAAKQAKLPEGSIVGVALYGSAQLLKVVRVIDGRGELVHAASHRPTAALTMHEETFLLATTGRVAAATLLERGKISLRGDIELGTQMALALRTVLL
jgi:uncharacterized protein (TIGR03083 family)